MCKEIEEELQKGKEAAVLMVEHLIRMGAANGKTPVELDGKKYEVTVKYLVAQMHLVERPDEGCFAVLGDPINSDHSIKFANTELAGEYVRLWNEDKLLRTLTSYHVEECCGCSQFYYSEIMKEVLVICNECGELRIVSEIGYSEPIKGCGNH